MQVKVVLKHKMQSIQKFLSRPRTSPFSINYILGAMNFSKKNSRQVSLTGHSPKVKVQVTVLQLNKRAQKCLLALITIQNFQNSDLYLLSLECGL